MVVEDLRAVTSTRRDLRNFGLVVGSGFCLIAALMLWRGKAAWTAIGAAGLTLVILGLVFPTLLKPLQRMWMSLAVLMGWFMTRLILTVLYFAVLTPLGAAAKLAGRRFLDRAPDPEAASYWIHRSEGERSPDSYEKQF